MHDLYEKKLRVFALAYLVYMSAQQKAAKDERHLVKSRGHCGRSVDCRRKIHLAKLHPISIFHRVVNNT